MTTIKNDDVQPDLEACKEKKNEKKKKFKGTFCTTSFVILAESTRSNTNSAVLGTGQGMHIQHKATNLGHVLGLGSHDVDTSINCSYRVQPSDPCTPRTCLAATLASKACHSMGITCHDTRGYVRVAAASGLLVLRCP